MVIAILPFAIGIAGGGDGAFSVALAVQGLTMVLFLLPAGIVGDRFDRRKVIVAADLLRFAARGAFVVLLILGEATFWQLLLAQAANGAGTALFNTTMDGFVPEVMVDEKRLLKVNGLRFLALSLGMTVGPAMGSLIFNEFGAAATFGVDAGTFVLSAFLIYRLPTPFAYRALGPVTMHGFVKDATDAWRMFWKIRWYWRVATEFAALNALVFAPYFVIAPHVAQESLGGSWAWSQILAGMGAGQLLGAIAVMICELRRPLLVATSLVAVWVLPLIALAAVAPVSILASTAMCAGGASSMFGSVWETVKQTHTPSDFRARLGSFDHLGSLGLVPFGYLLGGLMLTTIGPTAGLIVGVSILLVATSLIATDPSVRDLRSDKNLVAGKLVTGP